MLNVAKDNTTVVIYHRQFAYPESFIVQVSWDTFFTKTMPRLYQYLYAYILWQYYKLRFNYNIR